LNSIVAENGLALKNVHRTNFSAFAEHGNLIFRSIVPSALIPLDRFPALRRSDFLNTILLICPLVVFLSVLLWFSHDPISPTPVNEASLTNPVGFLTSNFVYDGIVNIETILTSSAYLLLVCIFYPRNFRFLAVCLLPLVALGAGALAELTAISTHYTNLGICTVPCSFYGMSAVAAGAIGFTIACFLIWFGLQWLGKINRIFQSSSVSNTRLRRNRLAVMLAFASYILLLLFFSGILGLLIPVPAHPQTSTGTPAVSPPPPAVLTESTPTAFVHSAGLVYGFLFCISLLVQVNRHYDIFGLAPKK
jgi:hypothetical protein